MRVSKQTLTPAPFPAALLACLSLGFMSCSSDEKGTTTPPGDGIIPAPAGLTVADYDTLAGVAHLRWNAVKHPDLSGYVVYRSTPGNIDVSPVTEQLIQDTTYVDSIFKDSMTAPSRKYEYRVLAIGGNLDVLSKMSIAAVLDAVSPATITTTLSLNEPDLIGNLVGLDENVRLVASFSNPSLSHGTLRWFREGQTAPLRERAGLGRESSDTLDMRFDSEGLEKIRLELMDERGMVWKLEREYPVDGPPIIEGLRMVKYDTLKGEAHLTWNRTTRSGMRGYVVYRFQAGREPKEMHVQLHDTVFIDKVYSSPEGAPLDLVYRVKILDGEGFQSPKFSREIAFRSIPPSEVLTKVGMLSPNFPGNLVRIGDTLILAGIFSNPTRAHDSLAWYFDGGSAPVRKSAFLGREGSDTLRWVFTGPGKHDFRLELLDAGGNRVTSATGIRVSAITGVHPDSIEQDLGVEFSLTGHQTWFNQPTPAYGLENVKVVFQRGSAKHLAVLSKTLLRNDTLITGLQNFPASAEPGLWNVRIDFPDRSFIEKPNAVRVVPRTGPLIRGLHPDSGKRGSLAHVTVTGHRTEFFPGTAVILELNLYKYPESAPRVTVSRTGYSNWRTGATPWSNTTGEIDIDLPSDAPLGNYDVEVRTGKWNGSFFTYQTWPLKKDGFRVVE